MESQGSVYLLYHFFHPDDVVSGRLFSDLAEDLTDAGFTVTALPSIRSCHGRRVRLKQRESWAGGQIRRVWRPDWPQHRSWGRFGNTLFMLAGWTWRAAVMPRRKRETMIVGTDPVLAVLIAITWRLLRPRAKIVHWCHDVYPHAAIAEGMIPGDALWVRLINFLLRIAYRRCDVIGDLGICMRRLLQQASGDAVDATYDAHPIPSVHFSEAVAATDGNGSASAQVVGVRNAREVIAEFAATIGDATAQERLAMQWNPLAAVAEVEATLAQPSLEVSEPAAAAPFDVAAGITKVHSAHRFGPGEGDDEPISTLGAQFKTGGDSHWRSGRYATLVPWSLVEPTELPESDPAVRRELFGSSRLGLLYSGNFGRAHCFDSVLALARRMRGDEIGFCFAGRGMRLDAVRQSVTADDTNIRFAGFAAENELESRLAAADIHLVTLRPSWTGAVVPSKFFGALAAGRPVLFSGSRDSAIARWITELGLGWVLTAQSIDCVAAALRRFADDPLEQEDVRQRCFDVYHRQFSRSVQIDHWLELLTDRPVTPRRDQWFGRCEGEACRSAAQQRADAGHELLLESGEQRSSDALIARDAINCHN